eukprot:4975344-Pyramimonas_sp.AAC.1
MRDASVVVISLLVRIQGGGWRVLSRLLDAYNKSIHPLKRVCCYGFTYLCYGFTYLCYGCTRLSVFVVIGAQMRIQRERKKEQGRELLRSAKRCHHVLQTNAGEDPKAGAVAAGTSNEASLLHAVGGSAPTLVLEAKGEDVRGAPALGADRVVLYCIVLCIEDRGMSCIEDQVMIQVPPTLLLTGQNGYPGQIVIPDRTNTLIKFVKHNVYKCLLANN